MSLVINIHYTGKNGSAVDFMKEMIDSGIVNDIRSEKGNIRYHYYIPIDDKESILLIDEWENQAALDAHHKSENMQKIATLRTKYKLKMQVERFIKE